jgi:lycopene beta-cyclase
MTHYHAIIAGGGAAGLSLAYHLTQGPLRHLSLLIVDQDAKDHNDRTFCYWTDLGAPSGDPFEAIVHRTWDRLRVAGEAGENVIDMGAYRYKMIRGIDLYRSARRELPARGAVEFLRGTVERIDDGDEAAHVVVDGRRYTAAWAFDARGGRTIPQPDPARYHRLVQQFTGWEVATSHETFCPHVATFLDFRMPQQGALRFFYVLPLSERRALVECVVIARAQIAAAACEQALAAYLASVLGLHRGVTCGDAYRVEREEHGATALTDQPFPRRVGRRIMTIGVLGGRVKPSTGFAFLRIQQDSAAIARSLLTVGHPFAVPPDSRRYRLYDSLLLQIMARHAEKVAPIMTALFKNNPAERVCRFLDERASPWENLGLIATLPPAPFLQALFRREVLRRV